MLSCDRVRARGRAPRRDVRRLRQQYATAASSSRAASVAPTAIAATSPALSPPGPFSGVLGSTEPDRELVVVDGSTLDSPLDLVLEVFS